jgi:superfamily II DNA or RNA helicase
LESAIKEQILCEFDYNPLSYTLTKNDKKRIASVYKKAAAKRISGNPMTEEQIWMDIARVYKTAENKPLVFKSHLATNPEIVKSSIIFVETKEFGNQILPTLQNYTTRYRTYYGGEDSQNLIAFGEGRIDCLITCHRLSQGIDIPHLENVVLFSSARSKLETIQRIGRCLRKDRKKPSKRAQVTDFVREKEVNGGANEQLNADEARSEWLTALSKTRGEET